MTQVQNVLAIISLAFEEGVLTSQQAMESCLEYGRSVGEQSQFDLQEFWLLKEWIAAERYEQLRTSEQAVNAFDTITEQGELDFLITLHHSLISNHKMDTHKTTRVHPIQPSPTFSQTQIVVQEGCVETGSLEAAVEPSESGWVPEKDPEQRYEERGLLGAGGSGVVTEVYDRNLDRSVARKMLRDTTQNKPHVLQMFVKEASMTGQLEHPNIIPIHDIGVLSGGQFFYTMPLFPSDSLAESILRQEHTIYQYIKILQQVCMGLEYAHSRGIVHRDIKPANIVLGQFGEVLLIDWGIAESIEQLDSLHSTSLGKLPPDSLQGTVPYMPPELIERGEISPAQDQYALGVTLYEMLTGGEKPFFHSNMFTMMFQIRNVLPTPPSQRAKGFDIPDELEQICLKMLSKNPQERYSSCRAVYDQLEEFLVGTKERARRKKEAHQRIMEAQQSTAQLASTMESTEVFQEQWKQLQEQVEPWKSLEHKEHLWQREDAFRASKQQEVKLFGAAVQKYTQALEHEPGSVEARKGLAELYWARFLEAEEAHDELEQIYYRDQVLFFDDGYYEQLFSADCQLKLQTSPEGAKVRLYQYQEDKRRLLPTWLRDECSPAELSLPPGSYLILLQKEGFRDVSYPLLLQRGEQRDEMVNLYSDEDIGEDYIFIPGGFFPFGGDPEARLALPLEVKYEGDFLISRSPVTFGEYLEFINETLSQDPELARASIPQSANEEVYAILNDQGQYIPHRESLFHGAIAARYPEGSGAEERLPVMGISWYSALLYCRWRSQKEGRSITLPTEAQWEKAAAGVDRRLYPWGNQFDATFCKMGLSREPQELQPEPIGTFSKDESPYGVCDMVGTISEWTLSMPREEAEQLKKILSIHPYNEVEVGWQAEPTGYAFAHELQDKRVSVHSTAAFAWSFPWIQNHRIKKTSTFPKE